jgi:hypothetical protein
MTCTAVTVRKREAGQPLGPSTGLFDVGGGQRLVTPPIRGRAGELKLIGGLVTAVAQAVGFWSSRDRPASGRVGC